MNANRMLVHEGLGLFRPQVDSAWVILGVGHYGPKYVGRFGPLPQMIGSPVYF